MLRRPGRLSTVLQHWIQRNTPLSPCRFSTSLQKQQREDVPDQTDRKEKRERTPIQPQADYADIWEPNTDDRIEQLTFEIRKASGKKIGIFGAASAFMCGKMGWYQFEFLGMPYEMEIVMVGLPALFCSVHWLSWYMNMSSIYKQLHFKLPAGWKANAGLIGGTNPEYSQLIVMNNPHNLKLLDEWTRQTNKHKVMCASLCAVNMTIIMLTGTINPLGDPALSALEPLTVMAYSCYPFVAYSFSAIIYGSPIRHIAGWKRDIMDDLGIEDPTEETEDTTTSESEESTPEKS